MKISEKRMGELLPPNIKDADNKIISLASKKVIAALLDWYLYSKAKETKVIIISNKLLCAIGGVGHSTLQNCIRELQDLDLIETKRGETNGEASHYIIKFQNLQKPLKKKTFEQLFFNELNEPKTLENPIGTKVKLSKVKLSKDKISRDKIRKEKDNIINENELIEEYEKPIGINTISENDFERNEKSFERNDVTKFENNSISTLKEKQYFNTLKELNQQNTFNSVLQEKNNNINSNNSMNKETIQKELELFNGYENELFKCSTYEEVEALREKLFDWFMRITDNNSKVLKTEYLVTIKQFICKLDTKSVQFKAAEQTDNSNTKALNTPTTALNVQGEQIPSNDNLKPTEDKEKENDVQAIQTIAKDTNTKENQLQIELNESQKAGNAPRNSYAVQCGELQSNDNFNPTEGKEKALNGKSETVTDAVNMIETYEERINKVESVESVESLYANCKNYFKKWSKIYLESLTNDEIDFVKNKYKQMVNSKNDRLATLKYIMSVKLSK
jgi:hypothetical protein